MIPVKGSEEIGVVEVKKMKIVTAEGRAEVSKEEKLGELSDVIVEGETFVFSTDGRGRRHAAGREQQHRPPRLVQR